MLKKFLTRVLINGRSNRSERAANRSYREYHQRLKHVFNKVNVFKKRTK